MSSDPAACDRVPVKVILIGGGDSIAAIDDALSNMPYYRFDTARAAKLS